MALRAHAMITVTFQTSGLSWRSTRRCIPHYSTQPSQHSTWAIHAFGRVLDVVIQKHFTPEISSFKILLSKKKSYLYSLCWVKCGCGSNSHQEPESVPLPLESEPALWLHGPIQKNVVVMLCEFQSKGLQEACSSTLMLLECCPEAVLWGSWPSPTEDENSQWE